MLQYLIDENIAPVFRAQLVRHAPELIVRVIGDPGTPALGTLDPEILVWCEENDFVLVTNNRRSMPRHLADHLAAGRHVPGILVFDQAAGMGSTFDELELIAGASLPGEYRDHITYLKPI